MNTLHPHSQPVRVLLFAAACLVGGCDGCSDRTLPEPTPGDLAQRYAEAACAAEADCNCGLWDSRDACESELGAQFDALVERDFEVDTDCFDAYLASQLFTACPVTTSEVEFPSCIPMVGTLEQGEPCVPTSLMTLLPRLGCRDGLACSSSGVCTDSALPPKQVDDPCNLDFPLGCGADLYCAEDGHCAPRVADGQSCNEPLACFLGSFCDGALDGQGVCTPQLQLGEDCEPDELDSCAATLRCNRTTLKCDDEVAFACVNLAL